MKKLFLYTILIICFSLIAGYPVLVHAEEELPDNVYQANGINFTVDYVEEITFAEGETDQFPALVIEPDLQGTFGTTAILNLPAELLAPFVVDETLHFYYVADNGMTYNNNDYLTIQEDGSINLSISHASMYLVTNAKLVTVVSESPLNLAYLIPLFAIYGVMTLFIVIFGIFFSHRKKKRKKITVSR